MKLTSKQIQYELEYSPHKNVTGLMKAVNRHKGVSLNYEAVREIVVNGVDGQDGVIVAYELGLNPSYQPRLKRKRKKSVLSPKRTSKFKGVTWSRSAKKWQGHITILGEQKHLGYSNKEEVLAARYNEYAEPLGRKLNEVSA